MNGISIKATNKLIIAEAIIVIGIALMKLPKTPPTNNVSGAKLNEAVTVAATIARLIRLVAS